GEWPEGSRGRGLKGRRSRIRWAHRISPPTWPGEWPEGSRGRGLKGRRRHQVQEDLCSAIAQVALEAPSAGRMSPPAWPGEWPEGSRGRGLKGRRRHQVQEDLCSAMSTGCSGGALGRIRTCDTRFRKPVLYPLSYEGEDAP